MNQQVLLFTTTDRRAAGQDEALRKVSVVRSRGMAGSSHLERVRFR